MKAKPGAKKAKDGDTLAVLYKGTFLDGREFDSSAKHNNAPFNVTLGKGGAIEGFTKGLEGIAVGEKRKVTIPSRMAYGPRGSGPIPPNTPLVFELEVVSITDKK